MPKPQIKDIEHRLLTPAFVRCFLDQEWFPVHPDIYDCLARDMPLDYALMASSVDPALEQVYALMDDIIKNNRTGASEPVKAGLMDEVEQEKGLIEKISDWISPGNIHMYQRGESGLYQLSDDCRDFPLGEISLEKDSVWMGGTLSVELSGGNLDIYGIQAMCPNLDPMIESLLTQAFRKEYGYILHADRVLFNGNWVIKMAKERPVLGRTFMHFLAAEYNNRVMMKKYSIVQL